jgi:glycosyltransferase involved in cell wall biosynthesis
MKNISYCITVCDELVEFKKLLEQLVDNIDINDEIIVQVDLSKEKSNEIKNILNENCLFNVNKISIKYVETYLDNDFSKFKNNLLQHCSKEYIFQIDADELLNEEFFKNIKYILKENDDIDVFKISRENQVIGLNDSYINKWNWNINDKEYINYPDYQYRLFKNFHGIVWKNSVHEVLMNYKRLSILPSDMALVHNKKLEKQIKQNAFYETI